MVGENFRFGHRAAGDVPLLAELGEKYDFGAEGVPLLAEHGVTISSSGIRDRCQGDVAGAAGDLGRPHRVEGIVVRGHQRGRALGFPTANVETAPYTAIPADGVYAGWLASLDPEGQEEQAGLPRSRSAPTRPSTAWTGPSRPTRWTAMTWTCTACTWRWNSRPGCAARSGSTPSVALTEQMGRDVDEARDLVGGNS